MKRRGFFGALLGVCAVPVVAMLPKAEATTVVRTGSAMGWSNEFIPLFPGDTEYFSLQRICERQGIDWEEVLEQRAQEQAMRRKLKIQDYLGDDAADEIIADMSASEREYVQSMLLSEEQISTRVMPRVESLLRGHE